jgi:hypothetical protein
MGSPAAFALKTPRGDRAVEAGQWEDIRAFSRPLESQPIAVIGGHRRVSAVEIQRAEVSIDVVGEPVTHFVRSVEVDHNAAGLS